MSDSPRFFADAMLGTLARWLRVMGLDVLYESDIDDADLVERAAAEARVILTRDRRLVERRAARHYVLIASDDIEDQLRQVIETHDLSGRDSRLFGRCLDCNTELESMSAADARPRVPTYVARSQSAFRYCSSCDRVFWRATHVDEMVSKLRSLGVHPAGKPTRAGADDR